MAEEHSTPTAYTVFRPHSGRILEEVWLISLCYRLQVRPRIDCLPDLATGWSRGEVGNFQFNEDGWRDLDRGCAEVVTILGVDIVECGGIGGRGFEVGEEIGPERKCHWTVVTIYFLGYLTKCESRPKSESDWLYEELS